MIYFHHVDDTESEKTKKTYVHWLASLNNNIKIGHGQSEKPMHAHRHFCVKVALLGKNQFFAEHSCKL